VIFVFVSRLCEWGAGCCTGLMPILSPSHHRQNTQGAFEAMFCASHCVLILLGLIISLSVRSVVDVACQWKQWTSLLSSHTVRTLSS